MARKIDPELLTGFIEEAKGYIASILEGIQEYRRDPQRVESLKEAHRLVHIIKGASSMVGLSTLSHIAYLAEETIDDVAGGALALTPDVVATLVDAIAQIESYLDSVTEGEPRDRSMATAVTRSFRRLRGLPELGDAAAVEEALEPQESGRTVFAAGAAKTSERGPTAEEEIDEDVSREIKLAFLVEAEDYLRTISTALCSLEKEPGRLDLVQEIRRVVHTLKGAAGLVGYRKVSQLAHRMEDLLESLFDGSTKPAAEVQSLLYATADLLGDLLQEDADVATGAIGALEGRYVAILGEGVAGGRDVTAPLGEERVIDVAGIVSLGDSAVGRIAASGPARTADVVRVPMDRVDELVRLVSELVINRSTFEQHYRKLTQELDELDPGIRRLRRVTTKLETQYEARALGGRLGGPAVAVTPGSTDAFDDLEFDRYTEFHLLARELAETTADLTTSGSELTDFAGDFESSLTRQGHLTSEIQDRLIRLRMVPLATLAMRLSRAVRVTAQQQGKTVDFVIDGEDVELDKMVLEQMSDPLLHILRNAVDHGIEPVALRRVTGKPDRARVVLRAAYEATQIVIEVSDDGAGLDPEVLRSAAVRGGWVSEGDAEGMKDDDLFSLVFLPGFSTAAQVSEISGRGVGMDIVRSAVHRMKGTVSLRSRVGEGTTVTVRLPMTLAIAHVLLVRVGVQTYAVPLAAIHQILRLERQDLSRVGQDTLLNLQGKVYPFLFLSSLLGGTSEPDEEGKRVPVLIVNAGGKNVAWGVDELLDQREVVVKTLGSHLRHVAGITGATLMGDGSVVLILNPGDLAGDRRRQAAPVSLAKLAVARRAALNILIVDDSSSVRRILSNLVRSAGWNPITARDGLDALEVIQRAPKSPDLILLDIEMPRMDGYELAATLRAEPAYREIPIVMVTSRAGEKHRKKAFDLGVNDYVVKPYRDDLLVELIRRRTQRMHAQS